MFDILENFVSQDPCCVEYWNGAGAEGSKGGGWTTMRPEVEEYRHSGTVHECSTLMMGEEGPRGDSAVGEEGLHYGSVVGEEGLHDDDICVVGTDYRPRGVDNIFVTGAGLFPTAGSWNPTLTMTSLALHLSDTLSCTGL